MTGETCWFCKKAVSDPATACKTPMYGNVQSDIVWLPGQNRKLRTRWNTVSIDVPRCPACKAVHVRHRKPAKFGCLGISSLILGLMVLIFGTVGALHQGSGLPTVIVVAAILLALSVPLIWVFWQRTQRDKVERLALGIEDSSFLKQYPQVSTLLAAGWKIGEKIS